MPIDRHLKSNGQGQGMNWIAPKKRLAIYLRDGLACVYCGRSVEDGVILTLDHCRAHSAGGSNAETNLVTACHTCNSARGKRSWTEFARKTAAYLNRDPRQIIAFIVVVRRRKLDIAAAQKLINDRGGLKSAVYGGPDGLV